MVRDVLREMLAITGLSGPTAPVSDSGALQLVESAISPTSWVPAARLPSVTTPSDLALSFDLPSTTAFSFDSAPAVFESEAELPQDWNHSDLNFG